MNLLGSITYFILIVVVGQLLFGRDPSVHGIVLRLLAQTDHLLLVLFFGHVLVILLLPLHSDFRRLGCDPFDMVLFESYYDVDALEDVGDVVNPPFLHFQLLHRLVQVDAHLRSLDQELDELLGEFHQTVLLATLLLFSASILETRILLHILRVVGRSSFETLRGFAIDTRLTSRVIRLLLLGSAEFLLALPLVLGKHLLELRLHARVKLIKLPLVNKFE